jgi:hypothetical protein
MLGTRVVACHCQHTTSVHVHGAHTEKAIDLRRGLIYMATLDALVNVGALVRYESYLEEGENPHRYVYMSHEAANWVQLTLPNELRDYSKDLSPQEQVEQLLYHFITGGVVAYGSGFHPLDPVNKFTWELKTADVRLIGWFARKGMFVITCGRMKKEVRSYKCYSPCVVNAAWFRYNLELDEPKEIKGVARHDID